MHSNKIHRLPTMTKRDARRRGLGLLSPAKGLMFALSSTGKTVAVIQSRKGGA